MSEIRKEGRDGEGEGMNERKAKEEEKEGMNE